MFRSHGLGVCTALAEMGRLLNCEGQDRDKHHPPGGCQHPDLTSRLQALISTFLATDKFFLDRPEAFPHLKGKIASSILAPGHHL